MRACRSKAAEIDASALSAWYHAVTAIRNEIMGWTTRQSKHASVGWPLVTLLTCLQDDARFLANNEQLIEALLTRLKVLPLTSSRALLLSTNS